MAARSENKRVIFHVDVNSAFLSWEAARRVKNGEADIRMIPSAIGGDRDKRTGVILAKSIPAKKYGIRTGEAVSSALRKMPELYLARPDFRLYMECSHAFMKICEEYSPLVEKFSIDECFIDMTGMSKVFPDIIKAAYELKNRIRDELGFTVNVGVGSNKLLAKMASDFEKPDKVHTLFKSEIKEKMWHLPVRELYSVGRATAEKLVKEHIYTIGELASADLKRLQRIAGFKGGEVLNRFANGIDDSPVSPEREKAKGYSISTTLEHDIKSSEEGKRVILELADSVAARMRADGAKAQCISVTVRGNDFRNHSHQKKISSSTDVTSEIYDISTALFDELWNRKTPLRLIGISLTDLCDEDEEQLSLFETIGEESSIKDRLADKAVDEIRKKFGKSTIMPGTLVENTVGAGKKYEAQIERMKNKPNGKKFEK